MAAKVKTCSIEGCNGEAKGRGWCMVHYMRWKRRGDPLDAGDRAPNGTALRWIESVIADEHGDECVTWPFNSKSYGYGVLTVNGANMGAHRYVCMKVHGEPPTPAHQAAHSCGRGRHGCVNPRHLSWKTLAENHAEDAALRAAGIVPPYKGKLHPSDIRAIRELRGKEPLKVTAQRYNVHFTSVSRIQRGKRGGRVDNEPTIS